ncbi:hypothetical protein NW756_013351 [Fusarium oxysporum]|nr:hypothetical protein NW763_010420 [Fusarium oxysporum]KAJ4046678.1 hypothetical protein NW753_009497 [Fusarium oxysporum]KAJ4075130.1 hypothetical protein NW756_013351 [Fusarium oxysporum]
MATLSSLDVNNITPAVVTWRWINETRFLVGPDPQIRDITITTRFDSQETLFDLNIPIRLKGIKTGTFLIVRVLPSSISSFDFIEAPSVPDEVRDKFHSSTLLLDFRLNQCPKLLVCVEADEPLSPQRTQSGAVLDALRELANVTVFSVYIANSATSKAQLQQIRHAISDGLSLFIQDDLTTMFRGTGGKVVTLPSSKQLPPPAYDETEPPPPPAPIYDRKRPRKDDREERDDDIALIWAKLEMIQTRHSEELYALRDENKDLKQEINDLRERLIESERKRRDLEEEFGSLAGLTSERVRELEEHTDVTFSEVWQDMGELTSEVNAMKLRIDEDELANRVKFRVVDHITASLSRDMPPDD